MSQQTSREVHLTKYPHGRPTVGDFVIVKRDVPEPGDGEVAVRNQWLSVDPYMRGRMTQRESYIPPFELNQAMEGGAVGEVIASRHPDFAIGDRVMSMNGWRESFVAPAEGVFKLPPLDVPAEAFLGLLGMTGLTAWAGLHKIAALKPGETVLVSAAAGAVGSIACQLAKLHGAKVIASAGSDDKIAWLKSELGVDAAFNYKTARNLSAALAEVAPEGIDVYFENVGGPLLEAAIDAMRPNGRIAACGMISQYNATEPVPGPRNLAQVIGKSLRIEGFLVGKYMHHRPEFIENVGPHIAAGRLRWNQTVEDGIENMPAAFLKLFDGHNKGKMLVRLT